MDGPLKKKKKIFEQSLNLKETMVQECFWPFDTQMLSKVLTKCSQCSFVIFLNSCESRKSDRKGVTTQTISDIIKVSLLRGTCMQRGNLAESHAESGQSISSSKR